MKIAFFEVTEDWEKKLIHEKFHDDEILLFDKPLQEVDTSKFDNVEAISIFIYCQATSDILSKLHSLRYVGTRSTGFNHIDLEYCRNNQVIVTSVPHYGENTVAEFALALLLNISRKVYQSISRVQSGSFDFSGLRGFDLAHRSVGVLGFGNIGRKFAKMCKGLEMDVYAYDAFPDSVRGHAKELGVTLVDIDTIFAKCDVISLHLPLLDSTKHIINDESISKMKDGVVLINSARGELVDTLALLDGLKSNKVGWYGADVVEEEVAIKDEIELLHHEDKYQSKFQILVEDHALIDHPRSFITPHNAFNTQDALERILKTSIYNLEQFKSGEVKENLVK